jgi:hypothetical protein
MELWRNLLCGRYAVKGAFEVDVHQHDIGSPVLQLQERNDKTPLAGFEEKDYAPQANAHSRSVVELGDEMSRLRASTIDLFKSFSPEMLQRTGIANGTTVSVVNLGFIIAGHETHHRAIIEERYLAP